MAGGTLRSALKSLPVLLAGAFALISTASGQLPEGHGISGFCIVFL